MITTSIISLITLVSATAVAGLAGLWVDNVDRRWQQQDQPAHLGLGDQAK